jgi:hypothetical protein
MSLPAASKKIAEGEWSHNSCPANASGEMFFAVIINLNTDQA